MGTPLLKKRDPLLELILGRMQVMKLSKQDIADKLGICRTSFYNKIKRGSDALTISEIKTISKILGISSAEIKAAIKID